MSEFELSAAQAVVVSLLVDLVGISGVHKQPEQGECIVLDLLPASHVVSGGDPFCIRVDRAGRIERVTDEEAGIDHRPTYAEHVEAIMARFGPESSAD